MVVLAYLAVYVLDIDSVLQSNALFGTLARARTLYCLLQLPPNGGDVLLVRGTTNTRPWPLLVCICRILTTH